MMQDKKIYIFISTLNLYFHIFIFSYFHLKLFFFVLMFAIISGYLYFGHPNSIVGPLPLILISDAQS